MKQTDHPFGDWMKKHGMTYDDVAKACKKHGHPTTPEYLQQVILGFRRPGYDLAKVLSANVSGGKIKIQALMDFQRKDAA